MEIHARLLEVPAEGLKVLDDENTRNSFVIPELLRACNEKLSTNCLDVKALESLRVILCYEYQTFINLRVRLSYTNSIESKIDVKTFFGQNIENFIDSKEFSLVYDIVALQLALRFEEEQPIDTFEDIYQSQRHLGMAYDPCLCLRAFESIVDAHSLHSHLHEKVTPNPQPPELPPCIPKAILSWILDEARPEWPMLASLLPKLVEIFGTSNTIDPIWSRILTDERMTMEKILDTLCVVADVCFPFEIQSTQQIRYDYSISPTLWSILFRALDGPVSADRKKALFLIKKVSGFVGMYETQIRMNFDVSIAEMVPFIRKNNYTRASSTAAFRQTFFIIIESLEQQQKEMVMGPLAYVSDLVEVYTIQNFQGYIFDKKWMQCLYKRILKHKDLAIRKVGFREILETDLDIFDEGFLDFIAEQLKEVLLYEFDYSEADSPEVVQQLAVFFGRAEREEQPLIKIFIRSISKLIWSTVSLHWVLKAFVIATDQNTRIVHNTWTEEELKNMNNLFMTNLSKDHTLVAETRSALQQMLRLYVSPDSRWTDVGLVTTAILHIAGLENIEVPANHLQQMLDSRDAQAYVIQQCDTLWAEQTSESFASIIVALILSNLIFSEEHCRAKAKLHALFDQTNVDLCRIRPEMPAVLKVLELASFLMKKCKQLNTRIIPLLKLKRFLLRQMPNWVEIVESFVSYISILPEHVKITLALIKYNAGDDVEYLHFFYDQCVVLAVQDPDIIGKDRWLLALRVIYTYNQRYYHNFKLVPPHLNMTQLQLITTSFQTKILDAQSSDKKVIEKSCKAIARFIADYIEPGETMDQIETALLLSELRFVVDRGPRVTICIAVELIGELLQPVDHYHTLDDENTDIVLSLIHAMSRLVFKLEGARKECLATLIYSRLLSRPFFLEHEGSRIFAAAWVTQLMEQGSRLPEMKTAFVTDITDPEKGLIFAQSLVSCFYHGINLDLEKRIENLAAGLYGPEGEIDYPEDKIVVAYTVISMMDLLEKVVGLKSAFREKMLEGLLTVLKVHRNAVYGYNSIVHRIKSRTFRALLVMVPYLDENETRRLYNEVCSLLILEGNQSSIKMLQEWLIVRIYTESLMDKSIWKVFKMGMEKYPENIISIVSVTFQIAKVIKKQAQVEFITDAIGYLLPYAMGHRFNGRLYSQIHVVLVTMYDMLPEGYRFRFANLFESLRANLRNGKQKRCVDVLNDDFYFKEFDAIEDLNLEMIYEHLPRLMDLPIEERIEVGIFEALMDPSAYEELEVYALEKWRDIKARKPSVRSIRGHGRNNEERNPEGFVTDVQNKLRRFRTVGPVTDDFSDSARIEYERKIAQNSPTGIIVVATLVNRLRHLGQLARTCEVFAAKELVLSNLKYIERQPFKKMSSSAEDLISFTEVKKDSLKKYLIQRRLQGWKVVGAEQGAGSTNVLDAEFDKKTILLLGNETKGIPADLLPFCDMCVTIPGHGVIRSLNIQIAGAICIWQYAKQHTFTQL